MTQTLGSRVYALVAQLELPDATRALCLGSEARELGERLSDLFAEVTSVPSAGVGRAAGDGESPSVHAGDIEFDSRSFDLVVATRWLEKVQYCRWAIRELYRVLKPNGHLVLTEPNGLREGETSPFRAVLGWRRRARNLGRSAVASGDSPAAEACGRRVFMPHRLTRLLDSLGFEALDLSFHGNGSIPMLAPSLNRLAAEWTATCTRRSRQAEREHFFAHIDKNLADFRAAHRPQEQQRDRWLAEHPGLRPDTPRRLEELASVARSVLVLSPHPDDELVGCGGTLVKLIDEGKKVTVVQITDGAGAAALRHEAEERRSRIRLEEARDVAADLGATLVTWGEADRGLATSSSAVERMGELLKVVNPDIIFLPFLDDPHPDHRATNSILARALRENEPRFAETVTLSYEVWGFVPISVISVIDDQFDQKVRLLSRYRTGMKGEDYISFCRSLNALHSRDLLGRDGFVEGFLELRVEAFLKLCET